MDWPLGIQLSDVLEADESHLFSEHDDVKRDLVLNRAICGQGVQGCLSVDAEILGVMRLISDGIHAAFFCNISSNVIEVISKSI